VFALASPAAALRVATWNNFSIKARTVVSSMELTESPCTWCKDPDSRNTDAMCSHVSGDGEMLLDMWYTVNVRYWRNFLEPGGPRRVSTEERCSPSYCSGIKVWIIDARRDMLGPSR
jgi:hypothetical protein